MARFASLLLLALSACAPRSEHPRVIVLGIDGMDPVFAASHVAQLPNLARLAAEGVFQPLETTIPPQSPVAWSTFITGTDPGGHGVFDFVHRNPRTLELYSSLAETIEPRWTLPLGKWLLPVSSGRVRLLRQGKAFWQTLAENGTPVTIIRMPNNFPPSDCEGLSLAGMGTPDLRGSFGTFTFFTGDPRDLRPEVAGGKIVRIDPKNNQVVLKLEGPLNTLRRDRAASTIDITVDIDPERPVARFRTSGTTLLLAEKEWSEWVRVRFPLMGSAISTAGMFRIYVRQLHPHVRIYVSPVNIDPDDPAVPLSTPAGYSRELARRVGPYYTQGIAEDTAALRNGALSPEEFLGQAALAAEDHLKLFDEALASFEAGLLFFHFFGADQVSHMFWARNDAAVLAMYRRADDAIGRARKRFPDAEIIVISDHGFTTFDRAMHLNSWLRAEGLLTLKDGDGLGAIDWARTQAYAVGLNGLYLNLQGREKLGAVSPAHAGRIAESIRERLLAARDTEKSAVPVEAVYLAKDVYYGQQTAGAPDLIVGYAPGYRASWQTALGQTPTPIFEDNKDAWIGDHCVAARRVPGVLASNRKISARNLQEVTAALLARFAASAAE